MRVLVTGAAGYIGAHVLRALERAGHPCVALDDLSTGRSSNLAGHALVEASILDPAALRSALEGVEAVVHLAGAALVPESVTNPEKYWRINLAGGLCLLEAMDDAGVSRLIFSSTCAVHGIPSEVPIDESAPHRPISPYGASKSAFERLLTDVSSARGLRAVVFRYFNAAGAHEDGDIGEQHEPETHLIPIVLEVASGERDRLVVHGRDYDTPDGTCVRDYVDVRDIARAHVMALEALTDGRSHGGTYNLGQGRGSSVLEVVETCERVTGRTVSRVDGPRRPGDPPTLVARVDRVARELGWTARHDLSSMVETAWRFTCARGA